MIHVIVVLTRSIRSPQSAERVVLSHCQIVAIESVAVTVGKVEKLNDSFAARSVTIVVSLTVFFSLTHL